MEYQNFEKRIKRLQNEYQFQNSKSGHKKHTTGSPTKTLVKHEIPAWLE